MMPKRSNAYEKYEKYLRRNQASARRYKWLSCFVLLIAAIAVAVTVLQSSTVVIKEIKVTGDLITKTESEIVSLSGLRLGMNILKVDKKEIERNFSINNRVELVEVRIQKPDTVVLEVRERTSRAAVNCAGVILMIDMDGYILDRLSSVPQTGGNIPVINGMDVRVSVQGKTIESGTKGQIEVMSNVLSAIYASDFQQRVSELNVSDLDNLYLISDSGIQILIGDDEMLDAKLAWTRAVLDVLTIEGIMSGVVDVSSGNNAVYSSL